MGRVGVVGSINTDLVTTIDRIPAAGETRVAASFFTSRGGKGSNQAVAAARAGAETIFIGAVGEDERGDDARRALQADGIDTSGIVRVAGTPTGTATIIVEASGQNRILINAGANGCLLPADIDRAAAALAGCDVILLQLEIPLDTVLHTIELAARIGVAVLLNPAPATADLPLDRLGTVRFLAPNETEMTLLTGIPEDTDEHVVGAGIGLLKHGIGSIVVTRGEAGVLLVEPDRTLTIPAREVTAIDTTGAGDAFLGSFAARWSAGRDTLAAIEYATRYAAVAVTRPGAQASFPKAHEIDAIEA